MPAPLPHTVTPLTATELAAMGARHARRDPAECIEHGASCAGTATLGIALDELQRLMLDNFSEHQLYAASEPAPRIDDSLLTHMANYHTTENPVHFLQNRWDCASVQDVQAALAELRGVLEVKYAAIAPVPAPTSA